MAERAIPVRRYSVPTLDWVRMPEAGNEAEPPVFGLDQILDGVAEAGFQAVGLDDLSIAIVADPPPPDPLAALETAATVLGAAGVRMALEFAAYGSVATLPDAIAHKAEVRRALYQSSWALLSRPTKCGRKSLRGPEQPGLNPR